MWPLMNGDAPAARAPAVLPGLLALISAALFVLVVSCLPVEILAGAGHDDAWFWHRAESIVKGHWLGPYDEMTLMKGAGYPLFLAAGHALGLSVMTAQALLYSVACLLLGAAIYRINGRPWWVLLMLLALQWHPAALSWSRVIRDNIVAAQVLLALAALLHCLCAIRAGKHGRWWAALCGWTLAWLWLTREDGDWVLPGLLVLVLGFAWQVRQDRPRRRQLAMGALAALLAFASPLALVAMANQGKYGVFVTNDFRGGAFGDAMAALQRVRVGEPVAYVPVPGAVREAVYIASPGFARLRSKLEADGQSWRQPDCGDQQQNCGDYGAGAWPWALRAAVASIGAYADAPAAEAFYRQLADEVAGACDEGRLDCVRGALGLMPAMTDGQWRSLPSHMGRAVSLLTWQGRRDGWGGGHMKVPAVSPMWMFVGRPRVLEDERLLGDLVAGWYHGRDGGWIRLACDDERGVAPVARMPSQDVAAHFNDPMAQASRFEVVVPAIEGCALESIQGTDRARFSEIADMRRDFAFESGHLHIDKLRTGIPQSAQAHPAARTVRAWISRIHAFALPWLAGAGLVAFAWVTARAVRRRRLERGWLLAAAAWTLVGARLLLLVLVEASAFPAIRIHYMQPAFPLLTLAALASMGLLWQARGRRNRH